MEQNGQAPAAGQAPFVFACITPHGGEIVPELAPGQLDLMAVTRRSMQRLGDEMTRANPEVIVIVTPHGVRIDGAFAVTDCERMSGLVEENGASLAMERKVHRPLARAIVDEARRGVLPVGGVNYATSEGPLSCLPLDWGAMVPLYFMPETPIVVITPSRLLSMEDHIRFGQALRRAVASSGLRTGLIASCDWAHAHAQDGPYGFDPAAAALDAKVVELVKANDLESMAAFDSAWIAAAKPDGIWQTLILAGALPRAARDVELLTYEVPTYFGLLCAAVRPKA
ncbi:extradiol ring-cleavage dioxygenase [Alicyclobacillus cycloheptanicus]|nr:extradiol ring-cleavage dioxygenase [Alicyclobacillus cycloheptanicus]